MKASHIDEKLKDRRAYREALINKRNAVDVKISETEKQIAALKKERGDRS